jgi:hypothetical protein
MKTKKKAMDCLNKLIPEDAMIELNVLVKQDTIDPKKSGCESLQFGSMHHIINLVLDQPFLIPYGIKQELVSENADKQQDTMTESAIKSMVEQSKNVKQEEIIVLTKAELDRMLSDSYYEGKFQGEGG